MSCATSESSRKSASRAVWSPAFPVRPTIIFPQRKASMGLPAGGPLDKPLIERTDGKPSYLNNQPLTMGWHAPQYGQATTATPDLSIH